jgi:hypothetical protein
MRAHKDLSSDLLTIGLFAPLVMAARLQALALDGMRPTRRARREVARMSSEKPVVAAAALIAAQRQMMEHSLRFWNDVASSATSFLMAAPLAALGASVAPVRRKVRSNARRLTGF